MFRRLKPTPVPEIGGAHPATTTNVAPTVKSVMKTLLDEGDIEPINLVKVLARQRKHDIAIEKILVANGWVTPKALLCAQARYWDAPMIDPLSTPPDPGLIDAIGTNYCLEHQFLPLNVSNDETLIVTCRPENFDKVKSHLADPIGQIRMALCTEAQFEETFRSIRSRELIREAENRVPADQSCRSRKHWPLTCLYLSMATAAVWGFWMAPFTMQLILMLVIFAGMLLQSGLRLICLADAVTMLRRPKLEQDDRNTDFPLPVISVIVPLYKEDGIICDLVQRLSRLHYPRELTDILFAVESDDRQTKSALARIELPPWIRVVEIPPGPIRTKPRALNYALGCCRGEIIGIWDAEDQPEPEQLHCIARHFHAAPKDVGCLQGVLDYYNPRTNALARFFTVEYAAWFRVILPAMARLGFIVPLGGTTCFFRREVLNHAGAWDAWNVTEDADLGVRLARNGWRTEIACTVTYEEANCRLIPWIRQRSRWFKGYGMTWGVHMRHPLRLWRDLGPKRFIAFQVQFFFMLSQHLLAPAVWGFWLLCFGLSFPLHDTLVSSLGAAAPTLFLAVLLGTETLGFILNAIAIRGNRHRHLMPWAPFMFAYFPLASLAAWKSAFEILLRPFYWDKTAHGIYGATLLPAEESGSTVSVPIKGEIGEKKPASTSRPHSSNCRPHTNRPFWRKAG